MDFKQIEAFVNVVRYKSFSKAADASFFTQPTISTHIHNLEKELGVKLLDRKSRSVEMTPQGAKFYKYAIEMINARAQAVDAIRDTSENIEGILEIQTSSIPGVTFVPELLSKFREEHPGVQYYLSLSDTQSVIDNLIDRRGEIGFVGDKVNSHSVECVKVASDKSVLVSPESYGVGSEIKLSDTFDYPFIWRETGSATRKSFEKAAGKHGFSKEDMQIAASVNDLDSLLRSVESGLGVSVISEKVATLLGSNVKVSEISDFDDERDFYMIYMKSSSLSPSALAFTDFVRNWAKAAETR